MISMHNNQSYRGRYKLIEAEPTTLSIVFIDKRLAEGEKSMGWHHDNRYSQRANISSLGGAYINMI